MQIKKIQSMYDKISPFFTLLYIYDIENIPIPQLELLYQHLSQQKPIDSDLQSIYRKLEQASKSNIATKLKNKRQKKHNDKKQLPKQNKSKLLQQSMLSELDQVPFLDSSKINQSTIEDIMMQHQYKQAQRRYGTIYNGELIITLQLSDLIKSNKIKVEFHIDSKKRQSTVTKQTLKQLGLNSTNPNLRVDNRKQKQQFQLSNKNSLGLSFLQKNNVILQCNYRPQYSSFELVYTE